MKIIIGFFMMFSLYYINQFGHVSATSGNTIDNHRPRNPRPFVRVPVGRPAIQYARFKQEPFNDFIVDDDDLFELSKRQTSDDYGHLRFGKRGEDSFDDYGHMRFGRSGSEK